MSGFMHKGIPISIGGPIATKFGIIIITARVQLII